MMQIDEEKAGHGPCRDHPQWDLETAKQCARDVEAVLASDSYPFFLDAMYGDMPNNWSNELSGLARLRFISNAFTRMRYCFPERAAGYVCQGGAGKRARAAQAVVCYSRAGGQRVQYCLRSLGFAGRERHAGRNLRAGYRLLLGRRSDLPALGR